MRSRTSFILLAALVCNPAPAEAGIFRWLFGSSDRKRPDRVGHHRQQLSRQQDARIGEGSVIKYQEDRGGRTVLFLHKKGEQTNHEMAQRLARGLKDSDAPVSLISMPWERHDSTMALKDLLRRASPKTIVLATHGNAANKAEALLPEFRDKVDALIQINPPIMPSGDATDTLVITGSKTQPHERFQTLVKAGGHRRLALYEAKGADEQLHNGALTFESQGIRTNIETLKQDRAVGEMIKAFLQESGDRRFQIPRLITGPVAERAQPKAAEVSPISNARPAATPTVAPKQTPPATEPEEYEVGYDTGPSGAHRPKLIYLPAQGAPLDNDVARRLAAAIKKTGMPMDLVSHAWEGANGNHLNQTIAEAGMGRVVLLAQGPTAEKVAAITRELRRHIDSVVFINPPSTPPKTGVPSLLVRSMGEIGAYGRERSRARAGELNAGLFGAIGDKGILQHGASETPVSKRLDRELATIIRRFVMDNRNDRRFLDGLEKPRRAPTPLPKASATPTETKRPPEARRRPVTPPPAPKPLPAPALKEFPKDTRGQIEETLALFHRKVIGDITGVAEQNSAKLEQYDALRRAIHRRSKEKEHGGRGYGQLEIKKVGTYGKTTLYRSAQPNEAQMEEFVSSASNPSKVAIINLRYESSYDQMVAERAKKGSPLDKAHLIPIPIVDHAALSIAQVSKLLRIIESGQFEKVLVHCKAGKARTGQTVGAVRIALEGYTTDRAIAEAREGRMKRAVQIAFLQRFGSLWRKGRIDVKYGVKIDAPSKKK